MNKIIKNLLSFTIKALIVFILVNTSIIYHEDVGSFIKNKIDVFLIVKQNKLGFIDKSTVNENIEEVEKYLKSNGYSNASQLEELKEPIPFDENQEKIRVLYLTGVKDEKFVTVNKNNIENDVIASANCHLIESNELISDEEIIAVWPDFILYENNSVINEIQYHHSNLKAFKFIKTEYDFHGIMSIPAKYWLYYTAYPTKHSESFSERKINQFFSSFSK